MSIHPRKIYLFATIFVSLLVINNLIYYHSTRRILEDNLAEKMAVVAQHIRISMEHSEAGKKYVEELMADHLRTAALVAKYALPPTIEDIDNVSLHQLKEEIGIEGISLFQKEKDDIIVKRSSDPKEINLSTSNWKYWYEAFLQLYALTPVEVGYGQSFPHFWSGPFEVSTANPETMNKWGYFYDGSTNYIINPYIRTDRMKRFDDLTGTPAVIKHILKEQDYIEEITVFNARTFGQDHIERAVNQYQQEWIKLLDQPIVYGAYTYRVEELDSLLVAQANQKKEIITETTTVNGEKVLKTFIPVNDSSHPGSDLVIGIVGNYSSIEKELHKQLVFLGSIVVVASLISIGIIVFAMKYFQNTKEEAVQSAQVAYIQQLNELFTTIRGQRHDFLNHAQTIHCLVRMGKIDALKQYTSELMGEIQEVNDLIQIGHPAFAALIQSKLAVAVSKRIDLQHEVHNVEQLTMGLKSVDVVKIIGNLLDNAFDEVVMLPVEQRVVRLKLEIVNEELMIQISNPCTSLSSQELQRIFKPGFSKKHTGKHDGLGLAVIKERVSFYKGSITASIESGNITFLVKIPLDQ